MRSLPYLGAAALLVLTAPACATDFKSTDGPAPYRAPARPAPVELPQAAPEPAIKRDLLAWDAEVFRPLAFTNRTCVRLQRELDARCAGRPPTREETLELQRDVLSVRRGMLDRAEAFTAQTDAVREMNRDLCTMLALHIAWMQRVQEVGEAGITAPPPAPPELLAAKIAFRDALHAVRAQASYSSPAPRERSSGTP